MTTINASMNPMILSTAILLNKKPVSLMPDRYVGHYQKAVCGMDTTPKNIHGPATAYHVLQLILWNFYSAGTDGYNDFHLLITPKYIKTEYRWDDW